MNFYDRYKSSINTVLLVGAGFLAYSWYRSSQKAKDLQQANQAAQSAATELQQLAAQGITPTHDVSEFDNMVNQLVQAMTGCGTDEDSVFQVFSNMENEADIRQLVSRFGVQFYQPCAWTSPVSYSIWLANDQAYGGGLGAWLGYDLSASDIGHINNILAGKGINYRF